MIADPAQAVCACRLDRSCWSRSAQSTASSKQLERSAEEMGNKVRVAVRFLVDRLEPVGITVCMSSREIVFFPAKGGFPTNASNPGFSRSKTSGTRSPSERETGCVRLRELADGCLEPLMASSRRTGLRWCARGSADSDSSCSFAAGRCRPRRRPRSRDRHRTATGFEASSAMSQLLAEQRLRRRLRRFADLPALVSRPAELPLDRRSREVSLLLGLPVEAHDLLLARARPANRHTSRRGPGT